MLMCFYINLSEDNKVALGCVCPKDIYDHESNSIATVANGASVFLIHFMKRKWYCLNCSKFACII